jgi:hypothetical protein
VKKKVVLGMSAGAVTLALALGIGITAAHYDGPAGRAPAAESRPAQEGEMPAPPAPAHLKPSERVVVIGK